MNVVCQKREKIIPLKIAPYIKKYTAKAIVQATFRRMPHLIIPEECFCIMISQIKESAERGADEVEEMVRQAKEGMRPLSSGARGVVSEAFQYWRLLESTMYGKGEVEV